jgi:putative hydrolase of the HAD superfamily
VILPVNVKAIIFDLDDTLYPERDYFISGFSVVANELESRGVADSARIIEALLSLQFAEGREGVFQKASRRLGFPERWIPELVAIVREHTPRITLPRETIDVLRELKGGYLLGCVTDGWTEVQRRKINALGISEYLDAIVIADEDGREFWKPNPHPLRKCCKMLNTSPSETVFVGDNPERDIAAAENAEMRSVLFRRPGGYFESSTLDKRCGYLLGEISHLSELCLLLKSLSEVTVPDKRSCDRR